jgi:predicted glycosyltransferase
MVRGLDVLRAESFGAEAVLSTDAIWLDIESPAQVQYLAPFVAAVRDRGREVVVSARNAGVTVELLRSRGIEHIVVGAQPPSGRWQKGLAVSLRALRLMRFAQKHRAGAVVCSSRAGAIVARGRGIPCFVFCDYEHADLDIYRRVSAIIVHPEIVPESYFRSLGFRSDRLLAFRGLKEDISFAGFDLDAVVPYDLGVDSGGLLRILVRPAAETSHYFQPRSRSTVLALLDHLARRDDVLTVFSPRYPSQIRDVMSRTWVREPVVLARGVPFISLLKSVDRVVSAGGTMLREAAYLGVPAYSLFAGRLGAVDEYLSRTGRLVIVPSADQLDLITAPTAMSRPLPRESEVVYELTDKMLSRG